MPHFFINSTAYSDDVITISDKENYNHIAKSLRIRNGEFLLLIDENQIQYETIVTGISAKEIFCKVHKKYKSERNLKFNLYLAQSPLRSDAQGFVIEKATELGVRAVIPILSDNCALNKSVVEKKIERWNRIMIESSKQCERAIVPICEEPSLINELISSARFNKIIAFCERRTKKTLREFFVENPIKEGDNLLVIIGPEGGFSEKEFEFFEKNSVEMLTLGDMILRAETAVTVALGNIIYEFSNN